MKKIELLDKYKDNVEACAAIDILQHTNQSLCIYGGAGTGKSTLINTLVECLDKNIVLVAPTGVAAKNIGGTTIHSFFGIPTEMGVLSIENVKKIKTSSESKKLIESADIIIIDEISMVSSGMLDIVNSALMIATGIEEPFGGKQMVFIGDPYQLPPIVSHFDKTSISKLYNSEFFFDAGSIKELVPKVIELKQCYRQNDNEFIEVLNNIRNGKNLDASLSVINKRVSKPSDEFRITLATSNKVVQKINQEHLNKISEPQHVFRAEINGFGISINDTPADRELHLKKGAQVMFIKNDTHGRYVNGTLGTIKEIKNYKITVETEDGEVIKVEHARWTKEERHKVRNYDGSEDEITSQSSISQYPLKLAWAITIHKSQGLTFKKMHFNNTGKIFASGQLYVALSRCSDLDGLSVHKRIAKENAIVDEVVDKYYCVAVNDESYLDILEDIYLDIPADSVLCIRDILQMKEAA